MANEINGTDEATSNGKPFIRRKRVIIPLVLLLAIAAAAVWYWDTHLRGWVSTDDATIDGDQITVGSKVLGRVAHLTVDEGDSVTQGEVIATLDSADLKAQEAQAEATVAYVKQNVPVAQINLQRARDDFQRAEIQYKGDVIPREQYDHARKALDLAQAQYNAASSQIGSAEAQVGVLRAQLTNMTIVAPRTGVVAKRWVEPGTIVQAGQPIYTLYDPRDIWITANFEETKLRSIRIGEPVDISVDAYPGRKFTGKVLLIGAAAASQFSLIPPNNASGNFTKVTQRVPVRISMPVADPAGEKLHLLPGMSVEVRLRAEESRG